MNELELNNEQIRLEISQWMSELFNKNIHTDNVKIYVNKLVLSIVSTKLKNVKITFMILKKLCETVENEFK